MHINDLALYQNKMHIDFDVLSMNYFASFKLNKKQGKRLAVDFNIDIVEV